MSLREGPKRRKRRLGRVILLGIVGAGLALALSEGLRKKVLDTLFGAEEEFEYTSTTTPPRPRRRPQRSSGATAPRGPDDEGAHRAPSALAGSRPAWPVGQLASRAMEAAANRPRDLAGDKAQRIVDAMRASVARRGAAGSTFDHVAREAGVSRGLLHYYFGTKERLLVEVVRRDAEFGWPSSTRR